MGPTCGSEAASLTPMGPACGSEIASLSAAGATTGTLGSAARAALANISPDGIGDTGPRIGGVATSDDSGSEIAIVGAESGLEGGIPLTACPFAAAAAGGAPGARAGSGDGMAAEGTGGGGIPAAGG